jgi:hypothetical protein
MMTRITVGGFIAGIVMFIWSFVAHMLLPVGAMGISANPGEDQVLASLKSMNQPGLYLMPGYEYFQSLGKSSAEQQAAMQAMNEKAKHTGSAFIVYRPEGGVEIGPKTLGLSLFADVIACWIFAFAVWAAMPRIRSFSMRVWLVTIMGLLPFVLCDFGYWNWYGFPGVYMLGRILDYSLGTVFAGIFLAWWLARGEEPERREALRMAA